MNLKSDKKRRMDSHRTRRRRITVDQGTRGGPLVAAPLLLERDWSELPVDMLSLVFAKLGAIEILMGVGLVCCSWLKAARMPELWRSVDMASHKLVKEMGFNALRSMAKVAVDRSDGLLQVFVGKRFVDDELMKYIGDRASLLKTLRLISCNGVSNQGLAEAATKFPLLDELELSLCSNIYERFVFDAVGRSCPKLTRFRRNENRICGYEYNTSYNRAAMGIATMAGLRSLQLFSNSLTNAGLTAILDGCTLLEALDIRYCFNIKMDNALQAKCGRLKTLRLPKDSVDDYEFQDQLPFWVQLTDLVLTMSSSDDDDDDNDDDDDDDED